jgi:hypothetical protein
MHGGEPIAYGTFLHSAAFGVDLFENWQSEYLQFVLFILATVWFVQKGSSESKDPGDEGVQDSVHGFREHVRANGLVLVFACFFFLTWYGQSVTGLAEYNGELKDHGQAALRWSQYARSPVFWNRTLQNWQSEFLAVGSMAAFSVFLRQRGSPESKRLDTPHDEGEPTY